MSTPEQPHYPVQPQQPWLPQQPGQVVAQPVQAIFNPYTGQPEVVPIPMMAVVTPQYQQASAPVEQPPERHRRRKWPFIVVPLAVLVAGASVDVFANNSDVIKSVSGGQLGKWSKPSEHPANSVPSPVTPTTQASTAPVNHTVPTIVLDPAFSGTDMTVKKTVKIDGQTYTINDHDFPTTTTELYENFDIATCTGQVLSKYGMTVVLTKDKATDYKGLVDRTKMADTLKADMMLTIRSDHSVTSKSQLIYDQKGVEHNGKYGKMFRRDAKGHVITFTDKKVAAKSHEYAQKIAAARSAAQGESVELSEPTLGTAEFGGTKLQLGNLWVVQAVTNRPTPVIYSVAGVKTDDDPERAMSIQSETAYALGLVRGIEAALPIAGASASTDKKLERSITPV